MDLELEDFNTAFTSSEVVEIPLKCMGGGSIYIRALGRADVTRFRNLCKEINTRTALNIITNPDKAMEERDSDLDNAEDYLLIKSLCDRSGERKFKDNAHFKNWSVKVDNDAVEEILKGIKENFILKPDDIKKKPQ